jgi:hypothetical protein
MGPRGSVQTDQFPARILGKLERIVANDKILAFGRGKPMLAGERDMAVGTGRPRNRSDSGGFSTGYGIVRYPCRQPRHAAGSVARHDRRLPRHSPSINL